MTHFRFPAWLVGFITGYILFRFPKGSIRIPKVGVSLVSFVFRRRCLKSHIFHQSLFVQFQRWNLCALTISVIVMTAIAFTDRASNQIFSPILHALCHTLGHIIWSIAVCYIIFACIHGSGGPINTFLSLPMWQPISKLSYGIYLVHGYWILIVMNSTKTPLYFNEFAAFQESISFCVLSMFVAMPLTLAFELPIDAISKLNVSKKVKKWNWTNFTQQFLKTAQNGWSWIEYCSYIHNVEWTPTWNSIG